LLSKARKISFISEEPN